MDRPVQLKVKPATGHPDGAALTPGDWLDARYRLETIAGRGGMSTVWRATDIQSAATVAVKVMSDALAGDPRAVSKFEREAQIHEKIAHPNVVTVHTYNLTPPRPYIVLEYVAGATLSERLDCGLSPPAIQTLTDELLCAVGCVHDHGLLHGDIKPANVLLDLDGRAHLADFGVARPAHGADLSEPAEVAGTLRFLAPELIQGLPPSRQSDLFALGMLLCTVAGNTRTQPALADLVTWLTDPVPKARPHDAWAALTVFTHSRQAELRTWAIAA